MFIRKVVDALNGAGVTYTVVGGYALVLHGVVRGTVDIDIVISLDAEAFKKSEAALISIGLTPRLPITAEELFNFREEYIANRNLKAWSFYNPDNLLEVVDILITKHTGSIDSVEKRAFGMVLNVASIEALIAMKREAGRPQDIEDVKALERLL